MPLDTTEISDWFKKRLPQEWQSSEGDSDSAGQILVDRDEIVVIGSITAPNSDASGDEHSQETARRSAIKEWREQTREKRMEIASAAQEKFGKHVSWGASIGDDRFLFTHVSVPTMTRLKITERQVLDTLVDAGVAGSRSEALGWCVRYVAKKEEDWLKELRNAFESVSEVRAKGPKT